MKFLLLGLLCLTVLFTTACSQTTSSSGKASSSGVTNVVFWDLFGGADGTTMNSIVKEFNQTHPHIHIQEETQDWGQYYTKLITSVLGGVAPDLAISHVDHLAILKAQGVIQPLDTESKSIGINWNEFFKPPMKDAVIDGKHYAIPLDIHTLLLYSNKKILAESGIDPNNLQINSYDQFVSVLEKVKAKGYVPLSFPENGWFPLALWETFYIQMGGGDLLNSDQTQEVFTDPKNMAIAVDAMQKVVDLYNKYKVIPSNISNSDAVFMAGKAAFTLTGTWNVDTFTQQLGQKNMNVTEMPKFFKIQAAFADSHTFILPTNPNRTPAQMKAAMTFVKWVEDHAWKWAKAGHIPANKTVQNTSEYKQLPYRSNYGDQANFAVYFPMNTKVWLMTDNQVLNEFQNVLLGNVPVKKGVQDLGNLLNRQLKY